jgi:DNA-binding MarR family transcriptional regulator
MPISTEMDLPIAFENKSHEALMNVWWTANLLRKVSTKFFQESLSSDAQFNILILLKDSPTPLTQKELSQKLLVDKSNITGLLDRLEKQRLIKREAVLGDRRSYHIKLTKQGDELVMKLDKAYQKKVREIMNDLSAKDCDDLIRLTRKIRASMRRQTDVI